ncbi:MAG: glycosyltransferase, partial [Gammaproteobacteria bacterium]|nr:glycosyltransferase [Gammaproteobacteria bacterium]
MRILNIICSTNPQLGGVIEWVRQFSPIAAALGHTVEVASMDNPDDDWVRNFPVPVHAFGHKFRYFYSSGLIKWIRENAGNYDVCITHGLWRFPSIATHMALKNSNTPYFAYTHGMLDPWFKTYYPAKHLAKYPYWLLSEYRVLREAKGVIFTCEQEKIKAKKSFSPYKAKELVTTIGIYPPAGDKTSQTACFHERYPETEGKKLLLFLGRIHQKKGCDLLIQAFAKAATNHPDLHLVFAGPGDDSLITQLKQLASSNNIAERVTWTGMITGDTKWGAFYASDAFILPSHQENFGISVVEAMACSIPVLISNKVDIFKEVENDNAGIIADDTLDGTCELISKWLEMSEDDKQSMQKNALSCYQNRFEVHNATQQLLELLETNLA